MYRTVLMCAEEQRDVRVDDLQRLHAVCNLEEALSRARDMPPTLRDAQLAAQVRPLHWPGRRPYPGQVRHAPYTERRPAGRPGETCLIHWPGETCPYPDGRTARRPGEAPTLAR